MTPGTVSAHVPSGHSFVVENSWFESQLLLEGGWPECGCLCSHFCTLEPIRMHLTAQNPGVGLPG